MSLNAITFDGVALGMGWARAWPGLVGQGAALHGLYLVPPRSPGKGVWGIVRLASGGTVDAGGLGHTLRLGWEIVAKGGEEGAKRQAFNGARAVADACRAMDGTPKLVTAMSGETARLWYCGNVVGPSDMGEPNALATYRVDADFVFLRA